MKPGLFERSISEHRIMVAGLRPEPSSASVSFKDYASFSIYRSSIKTRDPLPTVLYIAGNAFVASETAYTDRICNRIVELSGYQVILLKHRLAPEFKAPMPFEDIKCTMNTLLLSPQNPLNIDKNKVAICGYSSGGNLAALLTIYAKKHQVPIAHQLLISPVTDLSQALKGFECSKNEDTAISQAFVDWFLKLYIPETMRPDDPRISPYWSSARDLKALPPTDIVVGEFDRFKNDSEKYAMKLSVQPKNLVYLFEMKGGNHGALWHNPALIDIVVQRLRLSIGIEPVARSLSTVNVIRTRTHSPAKATQALEQSSSNNKKIKIF